MPLIALGLNHLTAPVSLREQVAFDLDAAGAALLELAVSPAWRRR
jgi:glutamyl-tRNA reductase